MHLTDAISRRRSIRKFEDRHVNPGLIEALLKAATLAPSGRNRQPWRFVILCGSMKDRAVGPVEEQARRGRGGRGGK